MHVGCSVSLYRKESTCVLCPGFAERCQMHWHFPVGGRMGPAEDESPSFKLVKIFIKNLGGADERA